MKNPNIDVDFKGLDLGDYIITIKYINPPNDDDLKKYVDTINDYKLYETNNPSYYHAINDEGFFGLCMAKFKPKS